MKHKKVLFLLLLSSFVYSKDEKSKISGELTFGVDTTFGADGVESTIRLLPSLIDMVKDRKYGDYENKKNVSVKKVPDDKTYEYIPKYSFMRRDLELAVKYLSQNIELRKRVNFKLKENYLGLGLKVDILG
ncbi:hypothetical protein, partial [Streptobacillus notomytis]|uniref:hypothetical protein n=1 Tax=Streptobacillus notomytis TaxID=1712031 RepID=UPI00117E045B